MTWCLARRLAAFVGAPWLATVGGSASGSDYSLTPAEITAEDGWLSSFGLAATSPFLLEQPFKSPFSARSFVVPSAWYNLPEPDAVAPSDFADDLEDLEIAMEKAYGGWEVAQAKGWNWHSWFEAWRASLRSVPAGQTVPIKDAFKPFSEYKDFQIDNHTNPLVMAVMRENLVHGSTVAALDGKPEGLCTTMTNTAGTTFTLASGDASQQPRAVTDTGLASRFYYIRFPKLMGDISTITCASKAIAVTSITTPTFGDASAVERAKAIAALIAPGSDVNAANRPAYRRVNDDIGVLRVPSLSLPNMQAAKDFSQSIPANAGSEKVLIVDLRANEGGFDVAVEKVVVDALGAFPAIQGAISNNGLINMRLKESCIATALRWGSDQGELANTTPPLAPELKTEFQSELDAVLAPTAADCPVTFTSYPSPWGYAQHHYEPVQGEQTIMVVTDNLCGSDCEGWVLRLARLPNTVVVGANTFGVCQFTQPGYFVLPRSKITFRMARGVSDLYGDNRSLDGYGLDVDVLLKSDAEHSPGNLTDLAHKIASGSGQHSGGETH